MKKISIIVPVYKVEEYLNDCVESLVNQTYKNLEIILVDDGSPDNCPKLCDEWAEKDERIKVIHKQNGGLSSARNAGLEIVSGDYVFFIDSDDSIHSQTCEILLKNLEKSDADISMGSFKNVYSLKDIQEKPYNFDDVSTKVYHDDEVYNLLFNKEISLIMIACCKLYKKEIFKDLRYEEGKIHEDEFMIHKILNSCKTFVFNDAPFYNYLQRRGTITKSTYSEKRLQFLEALENRIEFTKQFRPKFENDAILQFMRASIICYYRAKFAKFDKSKLDKIKEKIDFYYEKGYKDFKIKLFYKHPKIMEKLIYIKFKISHVI